MAQKVSNNLGKLGALPVVVAIVGAISACSSPTPSPEICNAFNSTIDNNIFEIAMSEAEGEVSDRSAMQQGARLTQNSNRLFTIIVNLQLQAQNQCPARQKPIDASIYTSQALDCLHARLEQSSENYGSDENSKKTAEAKATLACDFKAWNIQSAK